MVPARKIDAIIVHCSDSPDTREDITSMDIEGWHRERAATDPWGTYTDSLGEKRYIGYHFVVCRNGETQYCRPVEIKGCHCAGFNSSSIGVCWVGRSQMTYNQKESLIILVGNLCIRYGLEPEDVYGHNHFNPKKTCPNFNSEFTFEDIDKFRNAVRLAMDDLKT